MDLLLNENNDIVFNNTVQVTSSYLESVAQRLKIRLLTFLNEWFLDSTEGVPYFQYILGFKGDKSKIDILLQEAILKDPEVEVITSFVSELDNRRIYSCTFVCLTRLGVLTTPITLPNIEV